MDAAFSMEPGEFREMVDAIRIIEKAVSVPDYTVRNSGRIFCRSLFIVKDIKKGDRFTADNLRSIRPSNGLHPKYYHRIINSFATHDIERGTPLSWEMTDAEQ